jgi:hypothetical protein
LAVEVPGDEALPQQFHAMHPGFATASAVVAAPSSPERTAQVLVSTPAFGQSHDIDNLFVSDGSQFTSSAARNPTPTIVALAIRQAEYISREMSAGNI